MRCEIMANSTVTLKQIAEQAGVSITTVHRVLNGKEGCSEELKAKILRIAQEQGYTFNYVASSLRKNTIYLALLFPKRDHAYHYYLQRMLDGYLAYRSEVSRFNIVFQEYYYACEEGKTESLSGWLKNLEYGIPVPCDGVIMYGLSASREVESRVQRLLGKGVPVITMERSANGPEGSCVVYPDNQIAGRMGGELLANQLDRAGTVAILNQQLPGGDENGAACAAELAARRPDLKTVQLDLPLYEDQSAAILWRLRRMGDLAGVYITSARHTASYLRVCGQLPVRPRAAVGSELFEESRKALQSGLLNEVIDKRPYATGYCALKLMFDRVIKNEPLPASMPIMPRVILNANSSAYYRKEAPYGNNDDIEREVCQYN